LYGSWEAAAEGAGAARGAGGCAGRCQPDCRRGGGRCAAPALQRAAKRPAWRGEGRAGGGARSDAAGARAGQYVPVKVDMGAEDGGGGARGAVTVRLPPGQRAGAVLLEVVRGGFVSNMRPLLVLDSAAAVADVARLEAAAPAGACRARSARSWGVS